MTADRVLRLALPALALVALCGCSHLIVLRDALSASEHNDLGVVYESNGELGLAAKEYRKSVALEPHQAQAWINLGNVAAAESRWPAAEKHFRRALKEAPGDPDAGNNLAVVLLRQGRVRDARVFAEAAVATGGERDSVYRATLADVDKATHGPRE